MKITKSDFINKLREPAKQIEKEYGIPYLFTIAQAALESGWGTSGIGQDGNNLFGIKAGKSWTGNKVLVTTHEYFDDPDHKFPEIISIEKTPNGKYQYTVKDWFRSYGSVAECLADHTLILLSPTFKKYLPESDPKKYAEKIQSGKLKYATAPDYAKIMAGVIDTVKKLGA